MDTDKHGLQKEKSELRRTIRTWMDKISAAERETDSRKLCVLLEMQAFWKNAMSVLFFAPLPDEVDIWPLLEKTTCEKIAALPCLDFNGQFYISRQVKDLHAEIVFGKFGIREPIGNCVEIPSADLDLILVPGVAFDLRGNRLGRGSGFFDRLLAKVHGVKCGIAFDEQIVKKIPAEAHDVRMDFILTPTRRVEIKK